MTNEQRALLTIFGASGDLAKRKLYPSLFRLYRKGYLNEHFAVIGTARREWSQETFQEIVASSIQTLHPTEQELQSFIRHFYYQALNVSEPKQYAALKTLATQLDETYHLAGNQLFYLAMAPQFFGTIASHLHSENIVTPNGFHRLIIEKPFGSDYHSAEQLNEEIRSVFDEDDIFRIDHYLGKEMVQNISAVRFGNNIFESLWNYKYIDNVQVTLAESLGVEERGGYYDQSGALKDMVQNHILQIVALLAMEAPTVFTDKNIRYEKIKALESIRLYTEQEAQKNFVRGQYAKGKLGAKEFSGYQDEPNVDPHSTTETFVAGKLLIDNFRWKGVPFYIRTGKRLTEKGTRIHIVFKPTPINVFREANAPIDENDTGLRNVLTIYIQPTEGFSLTLNGKTIGGDYQLHPIKLDYRHSSDTLDNTPEAYEKLLLDALKGDATNFTHWDEVAQSWRIVDIIRQAWDSQAKVDFPNYASGTMGPDAAFELLERDGFQWVWQPDNWYREHNQLP